MVAKDRPLVWLHGEIKTPPFSKTARIAAGVYLRRLQRGELIDMSHSRPLPSVGVRCHELRLVDRGTSWRIIYRIDPDAIVILEVFRKATQQTPNTVIRVCKQRIKRYDYESN